ncbi:MAG: right-handed parallel beta-helix repeat-containing protein [Candidatus Eremiobacteraeota bacterium]|nr:right-handed parallel beta-helix repeat-containing protein [Candidatus Eremiobacteraeota bacterium]
MIAVAGSLLAACSGGSTGAPPGAAVQGASSLSTTRSTVVGSTGRGKVPQPFARGLHTSHARKNDVACTTVTPSADVISALEEPGTTATAAYVIDTPSGKYTKQDYDGSECDIAVYVAPSANGITITDSTIHDGIRAGLVIDGASTVKVSGNDLYNVGDHNGTTYTPDGVQYGFALMLDEAGTGETVSNNNVFDFQKDGILAFDAVSLALTQNDVAGAGAVPYIASNGIEMDGVNFTAFTGSRSSLNQYTGSYYGASGYLVCGDTLNGSPVTMPEAKKNLAQFNDIEIYVAPNADCS